MNIDVTNPIVNAFLNVALPTLVGSLIAAVWLWMVTRWQAYKQEQPTKADALEQICKKAVQAAKQYLKDNAERKTYAVNVVHEMLEFGGITGISEEMINAFVERAVGIEKEAEKFYRSGL